MKKPLFRKLVTLTTHDDPYIRKVAKGALGSSKKVEVVAEPFLLSPHRKRFEKTTVFLDDAHFRGKKEKTPIYIDKPLFFLGTTWIEDLSLFGEARFLYFNIAEISSCYLNLGGPSQRRPIFASEGIECQFNTLFKNGSIVFRDCSFNSILEQTKEKEK